MHKYNKKLKPYSRNLRKNQTDAEEKLWYHLRRKQLNNIRFARQKPIGPYIVDFYAHSVKLVIEIDGGQHYEEKGLAYDAKRDRYLKSLGLKILRFNNLQVIYELDAVLETIYEVISS
jgi:very-short-patch-repair endonuclease